MSKERELLKKMYDQFATVFPSEEEQELLDEVEELLAQPEPEPEPTTDKQTSVSMAVMPNGVSVSNVYDAYEAGRASVIIESEPEPLTPRQGLEEFKKGYAQAEQDLKREPLSDDELNEMADKYITDEACAGYFNGFRDAEKEHGIGE